MTDLYKKAVAYLDVLSSMYSLADNIDPYNEETIFAIEKLQSVLLNRLMAELYGKEEDYRYFLHYCSSERDFFELTDRKHRYGLLINSAMFDRSVLSNSPLENMLNSIFTSDTWGIDYIIGNLDCIYSDKIDSTLDTAMSKKSDFDMLDEIFSSRTLEEKLQDFQIQNFVDAHDAAQPVFERFFSELSQYFSYNSDYVMSSLILIRSESIAKYHNLLNREILSKEDIDLYDFIERCIKYLEIGSGKLILSDKTLKNVYFAFDFCRDFEYSPFGVKEAFGLASIDPRMALVPYLVDKGVLYLERKYYLGNCKTAAGNAFDGEPDCFMAAHIAVEYVG